MKHITTCSIAKNLDVDSSIEHFLNENNETFVLDPEKLNEDFWAINESLERIALSDGASESYNSKLWAKLLCNHFIDKQSFDEFNLFIDNVIREYVLQHNLSEMSWSQISAYERGSFATFIGVDFDSFLNKLTTISIGDSVCLLFKEVKKEKIIKNKRKKRNNKSVRKIFQTTGFEYIPIYEIPDFSINPILLSTNSKLNNLNFHDSTKEVYLDKNQRYYLILGTDAISDWLINQAKILTPESSILSEMLSYTATELTNYLYQIVIKNRNNKSMKIDDSTLLILQIN